MARGAFKKEKNRKEKSEGNEKNPAAMSQF